LSSAPPAPAAATSSAPSVPRAKRSNTFIRVSSCFGALDLMTLSDFFFFFVSPPKQAPVRGNEPGLLHPTGIAACLLTSGGACACACRTRTLRPPTQMRWVGRPSAAPALIVATTTHIEYQSSLRHMLVFSVMRDVPFATRPLLNKRKKKKKKEKIGNTETRRIHHPDFSRPFTPPPPHVSFEFSMSSMIVISRHFIRQSTPRSHQIEYPRA
jgi:hypothetical protein